MFQTDLGVALITQESNGIYHFIFRDFDATNNFI